MGLIYYLPDVPLRVAKLQERYGIDQVRTFQLSLPKREGVYLGGVLAALDTTYARTYAYRMVRRYVRGFAFDPGLKNFVPHRIMLIGPSCFEADAGNLFAAMVYTALQLRAEAFGLKSHICSGRKIVRWAQRLTLEFTQRAASQVDSGWRASA